MPSKRGRTDLPEVDKSASSKGGLPTHEKVRTTLDLVLRETEEAFFEATEQGATENPEVGIMRSCALVMMMNGKDIYLMKGGDSCVVLATRRDLNLKNIMGKAAAQNLQQSKVDIMREPNSHGMDGL